MRYRNQIGAAIGLAVAVILSSTPAFADGFCTGNSCNDNSSTITNEGGQGGQGGQGGEGGLGVGIGIAGAHSTAVAGASASNRTDVDVTSVNVNSASAKGGSAYAKGGTAVSGAYSGGNAQTVTVTDSGKMHYSGSYEVKNVPNPPDVIANPTAPCRVSIGVAGSGVGFGFGVGSSVLDEGCDSREDARLLYNMGMPDTAIQRLCGKPEMAKVIPGCAKPATVAPTSGYDNGGRTLY